MTTWWGAHKKKKIKLKTTTKFYGNLCQKKYKIKLKEKEFLTL